MSTPSLILGSPSSGLSEGCGLPVSWRESLGIVPAAGGLDCYEGWAGARSSGGRLLVRCLLSLGALHAGSARVVMESRILHCLLTSDDVAPALELLRLVGKGGAVFQEHDAEEACRPA